MRLFGQPRMYSHTIQEAYNQIKNVSYFVGPNLSKPTVQKIENIRKILKTDWITDDVKKLSFFL